MHLWRSIFYLHVDDIMQQVGFLIYQVKKSNNVNVLKLRKHLKYCFISIYAEFITNALKYKWFLTYRQSQYSDTGSPIWH